MKGDTIPDQINETRMMDKRLPFLGLWGLELRLWGLRCGHWPEEPRSLRVGPIHPGLL